jgi:hypothetical protein
MQYVLSRNTEKRSQGERNQNLARELQFATEVDGFAIFLRFTLFDKSKDFYLQRIEKPDGKKSVGFFYPLEIVLLIR